MVRRGPAFGVLGALEFSRDGARISLPTGRRRTVLAALLVHAGRPVSAEALIAAAWPHAPPADPHAALHTVLSRLRSVLGPALLCTEPIGYRLTVDPANLDSARFEALRAQAADRPPAAAAALLDEALGLWRGPAFAEFADADFARAEATRLDRLRADTVEDRAALFLELGRAEDAAAAMGALLAEDAFRERALSLLMNALYSSGRQAEALDCFRTYRAMLAEELGLDPSPVLCELYDRILGHEMPPAASPRPVRQALAHVPDAWPVGLNSFIGREADAARLREVAYEHRLVSVTGPGGVGKTRLVAESLAGLAERLGVPPVVVELAAVRRGNVDEAVARTLGLGPTRAAVRDVLLEYLRVTAVLLVLDNCEHVLAETRALVHALGRYCPRVRVLATSRHRLECAGEHVVPLDPLPVPRAGDPPNTTRLSAAVRLFADRLRAVRPSADVTGESLTMTIDICRRLDGLPLALELAASRAAAVGLPAVHERIGAGLETVGGPATLRAVVEWSYDLLDSEAQEVMARLSVFDGAFDLVAAEQVTRSAGPVAGALTRLTESSLLTQIDVADATRYRMLGVVRSFAAERLTAAGQRDAAEAARADWARRLTQDCAAAAIGPRSGPAFARLDRGLDDLTGALRWCLRRGRLEEAAAIVGSLGLCAHGLGTSELYQLAIQLAQQPGISESPGSPLAFGAGAEAAVQLGNLDQARQLAQAARACATSPSERYVALLSLGIADLYGGAYDLARACWHELLGTAGLPAAYRADAHGCLALLLSYCGESSAATEHAAAARRAANDAQAVAFRAFATYVTGEVLLAAEPAAAVVVLREAIEQADRAGRTQAGHVGVVARIALLSALIRLGRQREAIELAPRVVSAQLMAGTWPQLWTTARIVAELFTQLGQYTSAHLLLSAADTAPSAPLLAGPDVGRYQELAAQVRCHISDEAATGITALASCLPRTEIIARAQRTLETLV